MRMPRFIQWLDPACLRHVFAVDCLGLHLKVRVDHDFQDFEHVLFLELSDMVRALLLCRSEDELLRCKQLLASVKPRNAALLRADVQVS